MVWYKMHGQLPLHEALYMYKCKCIYLATATHFVTVKKLYIDIYL